MAQFEITAPLVGMAFRPPAKDVVKLLPGGIELKVQRQPDNPYDENAVQVLLDGFAEGGEYEDIRKEILDMYPEGSDNLEAVKNASSLLPLGYIANSEKTGGKFADDLSPAMSYAGLEEIAGTLIFGASGNPLVMIAFEVNDMPEPKEAQDEAAAGPEMGPVETPPEPAPERELSPSERMAQAMATGVVPPAATPTEPMPSVSQGMTASMKAPEPELSGSTKVTKESPKTASVQTATASKPQK